MKRMKEKLPHLRVPEVVAEAAADTIGVAADEAGEDRETESGGATAAISQAICPMTAQEINRGASTAITRVQTIRKRNASSSQEEPGAEAPATRPARMGRRRVDRHSRPESAP